MVAESAVPNASTSKIRAILFDCDGVICPPMRFAKLLTEQHKITIEMTKEFFSSAFNPALLGEVDVKNLLPPYLAKWGWHGDVHDFIKIWLESESEPLSEVLKLVSEVRKLGYVTGLATNQESYRAQYMRSEMGFEQLFDYCFISCELGAMKPQTSYFKIVTERMKLPASAILFIDDQEHYLQAASKFGWQTILFDDTLNVKDKLFKLLS